MYFSTTATFLAYTDAGSSQVTGSVTTNTIGQPDPMITENIYNNGIAVGGPLSLTSNRGFTVEGFVNTSHGLVDTKVVQSIDFSNAQKYYVTLDGTVYDQSIGQTTSISSATTTQDSGNTTVKAVQFSWPLTLSYAFSANPDGSYQQYTTANQGFRKSVLVELNGNPTYSSTFSDAVTPHDQLLVDAGGNASTQGQYNSETYQYSNSEGACWNETVTANGGALTSVQGGSCARPKRGIAVRK
jgi:hypothetical protein